MTLPYAKAGTFAVQVLGVTVAGSPSSQSITVLGVVMPHTMVGPRLSMTAWATGGLGYGQVALDHLLAEGAAGEGGAHIGLVVGGRDEPLGLRGVVGVVFAVTSAAIPTPATVQMRMNGHLLRITRR